MSLHQYFLQQLFTVGFIIHDAQLICELNPVDFGGRKYDLNFCLSATTPGGQATQDMVIKTFKAEKVTDTIDGRAVTVYARSRLDLAKRIEYLLGKPVTIADDLA